MVEILNTEAFADLVIKTQKQLGKMHAEEIERQLYEFDRLLPKPSGDIHLPILEPDKAMGGRNLPYVP